MIAGEFNPSSKNWFLTTISYLIFIASAAVLYLMDSIVLIVLQEDLSPFYELINGFIIVAPSLFAIAVFQEFALKVREGKIVFLSQQAGQVRFVTLLFFLTLAVSSWLVIFMAKSSANIPNADWFGFLVLLFISYLVNWLYRFFKKRNRNSS